MFEKLKQYIWGGVAVIIATLAALFFAEKKRGDALKGKLEDSEGKSALRTEIENYDRSKSDAIDAEDEYRAIRTKYLNEHNSSGGPGDKV